MGNICNILRHINDQLNVDKFREIRGFSGKRVWTCYKIATPSIEGVKRDANRTCENGFLTTHASDLFGIPNFQHE